MPLPTPTQIESTVTTATFTVEIWTGVVWTNVSTDVIAVSPSATASAGQGVGYGVAPAPSLTLEVARERHGLTWDDAPVRVSLGFNGTNQETYTGRITRRSQGYDTLTFTASGYQDLIASGPEPYTPILVGLPAFTATTAISVDDPSDPACRSGLGNRILWGAGGRPIEQIATYPSALFYYTCQTSVLTIDWAWASGGDASQVLDDLCRAAGGVLFQQLNGVVTYQEPLTFAAGSVTAHYTDSAAATDPAQRIAQGLAQYGDVQRDQTTRRAVATAISVPYTTRRLQGVQTVATDQTPRIIAGLGSVTVTIDLPLPCLSLATVEADAAIIERAERVTLTVSAALTAAQRVSVTLTNPSDRPVMVYAVRVLAQPVVAVGEGVGRAGSATTGQRDERTPDNVYVQSAVHANRLAALLLDAYSVSRPTVTLSGCGYDPRRTLGEIVQVTVTPWAMTALRHRVASITIRDGVTMDLDVVDVTGLPEADDAFQVGGVYDDASMRLILP